MCLNMSSRRASSDAVLDDDDDENNSQDDNDNNDDDNDFVNGMLVPEHMLFVFGRLTEQLWISKLAELFRNWLTQTFSATFVICA